MSADIAKARFEARVSSGVTTSVMSIRAAGIGVMAPLDGCARCCRGGTVFHLKQGIERRIAMKRRRTLAHFGRVILYSCPSHEQQCDYHNNCHLNSHGFPRFWSPDIDTVRALGFSCTRQTSPGNGRYLSSAGNTASIAAACEGRRRGCGSCGFSTSSSLIPYAE